MLSPASAYCLSLKGPAPFMEARALHDVGHFHNLVARLRDLRASWVGVPPGGCQDGLANTSVQARSEAQPLT